MHPRHRPRRSSTARSRRRIRRRAAHGAGVHAGDRSGRPRPRATTSPSARAPPHGVGSGSGPRSATVEGKVPVTRLHLTKNIPVAAGMAGGSADAAAALLALNRLWGTGLDRAELRELAAELGADVPFCVTRRHRPGDRDRDRHRPGARAAATYHWVVGISDCAAVDPRRLPRVRRGRRPVRTRTRCGAAGAAHRRRRGARRRAAQRPRTRGLRHLRPEPARRTRRVARQRCARGDGQRVGPHGGRVGRVGAARRPSSHARSTGVFDRIEVAMSPAGGPDIESSGRDDRLATAHYPHARCPAPSWPEPPWEVV